MMNKEQFLENLTKLREERALEKKKESSAVLIQALVRGFLSRRALEKSYL